MEKGLDTNDAKKVRKISLSVYDVLCFATVQAMLCSLQVYLLAAKHSLHICKPQQTIKTQDKTKTLTKTKKKRKTLTHTKTKTRVGMTRQDDT
jgi:carbohydrate-binding DOMON domain-containing protein